MKAAGESYALGHSDEEVERLKKQSRFLEPFTRGCLIAAGVRPGMKVLEVGCGTGDVALVLAEMVGPTGKVIAVDRNPQVLETARARAQAEGRDNVTFQAGEIGALDVDGDFDALFGRLVLLHVKEPAEAVRALLAHLRPGALVIFQDFDMTVATSYPPSPLLQRTLGQILEGFRRAGADPQAGLKLVDIFRRAGLPRPALRCDPNLSAEMDWPGYDQIATVTRTLLPLLESFGLATAAEVDIDTLATRIAAEVAGRGGVGRAPDLISAWTQKPA